MIKPKNLRWAIAAFAATLVGCSSLLDVSDPTAVEESDIDNPDGAELLRRDALTELYDAVARGAFNTGLIADELFVFPSESRLQSGVDWDQYALDLRDYESLEQLWSSSGGYPYRSLQITRVAASHAVTWYESYGVESQRAHLGEMLAVRGYATLLLAGQICPGFALHDVVDYRPDYGSPLTTAEALERALIDLDSAAAYAVDSARIMYFAQSARARALVGLGHLAEAAEAASTVPTSFVFNGVYGGVHPHNSNQLRGIFYRGATLDNFSVADEEGRNGLDFVSAADPRVPVTWIGTAHDGLTELYAPTNYQDAEDPIAIATGIEARLIEAEADLNAGGTAWLSILNELRASHAAPPLATLSDPRTDDARVDLLFRERAFWLFGTGRRLSDLRRLITQYGRPAEDVLPTGSRPVGPAYGSASSIPFVAVGEDRAGTDVTGCMDR